MVAIPKEFPHADLSAFSSGLWNLLFVLEPVAFEEEAAEEVTEILLI